jgi:hypothetical protein
MPARLPMILTFMHVHMHTCPLMRGHSWRRRAKNTKGMLVFEDSKSPSALTLKHTMQLTMWALRPPTEAQSHELYCWGAEAANVWLEAAEGRGGGGG